LVQVLWHVTSSDGVNGASGGHSQSRATKRARANRTRTASVWAARPTVMVESSYEAEPRSCRNRYGMASPNDLLVPYRLRTVRIGVTVTWLTLAALAAMPLLPGHSRIELPWYGVVLAGAAPGGLPWPPVPGGAQSAPG